MHIRDTLTYCSVTFSLQITAKMDIMSVTVIVQGLFSIVSTHTEHTTPVHVDLIMTVRFDCLYM